MKNFDEIISEIILVHSKRGNKNVAQHLIKLQEEVGELAVAYLMSIGKKGHRKTKKEIEENLLEEAVDCIIITLSLIGRARYSKKKTIEMMNRKLQKFTLAKNNRR